MNHNNQNETYMVKIIVAVWSTCRWSSLL